jgi:heptosyltransferase II
LKRTLVISPNWIGDAVMAQPLLQLLRQREPQRPIDVLAPSWVAPVWRAMPEVDTVLEAPFKHGKLQLGERWEYARRLRQRGYADAYVLPNTLKFALIPWLAGIGRRVGYRGEMRYGLLNMMHHDDRAAPRPMIPFYAALAEPPAAACLSAKELPRPSMSVAAQKVSEVLVSVGLAPDRPLIVFAPGAEFGPAKRWPAPYFAELAQSIRQAQPHAQIVLLGSAKDQPVCDEIVAAQPYVKSLAGVTTLDQAIALIAQARVMVTNDSGLMHIASALNRPVIALYGPTNPNHTPPFSDVSLVLTLKLDCAPCQQRECPLGHQACMRDLKPALVWSHLAPLLRETAAA